MAETIGPLVTAGVSLTPSIYTAVCAVGASSGLYYYRNTFLNSRFFNYFKPTQEKYVGNRAIDQIKGEDPDSDVKKNFDYNDNLNLIRAVHSAATGEEVDATKLKTAVEQIKRFLLKIDKKTKILYVMYHQMKNNRSDETPVIFRNYEYLFSLFGRLAVQGKIPDTMALKIIEKCKNMKTKVAIPSNLDEIKRNIEKLVGELGSEEAYINLEPEDKKKTVSNVLGEHAKDPTEQLADVIQYLNSAKGRESIATCLTTAESTLLKDDNYKKMEETYNNYITNLHTPSNFSTFSIRNGVLDALSVIHGKKIEVYRNDYKCFVSGDKCTDSIKIILNNITGHCMVVGPKTASSTKASTLNKTPTTTTTTTTTPEPDCSTYEKQFKMEEPTKGGGKKKLSRRRAKKNYRKTQKIKRYRRRSLRLRRRK